MKTPKGQPLEAIENECTADKLEYVRDCLQELQANVVWIQEQQADTLKGLALRGLVYEFQDLIGNIETIQAVIEK
jgi:hypothetical protein